MKDTQCAETNVVIKNTAKKYYKINHISKTKNLTKQSLLQKMSTRSILIYFANLSTYKESCIFRRPKRPFLNGCRTQTQFDIIWNFTHIILLAHCASFMSRWPLLREGGCSNHHSLNNFYSCLCMFCIYTFNY